jgi:hypothetical protein
MEATASWQSFRQRLSLRDIREYLWLIAVIRSQYGINAECYRNGGRHFAMLPQAVTAESIRK